jgi:hypothetical protein
MLELGAPGGGAADAGAAAAWVDAGCRGAPAACARAARELALVDAAAATVLVGPQEAAVVRRRRPTARLHTVTNVHAPPGAGAPPPPGCEARAGALFVGTFAHAPNRQALAWLLAEVLPALEARIAAGGSAAAAAAADLRVHVAGSAREAAPVALRAALAAAPRVVDHGEPPAAALEALYGSVRAALAPLRAGAGVKGKVGEAWALGVPVVGTPVALEGMGGVDRENCLVAATADAVAAALLELHADCALWRRLAAGGAAAVRARFSPAAAAAALRGVMRAVGVPLGADVPPACRPVAEAMWAFEAVDDGEESDGGEDDDAMYDAL